MEIDNELQHFIQNNNLFVIKNNEDLSKATICIKGIKKMQEKVKESFNPIIEQAHKSHKEAIEQRDKYLKPLIETERKFKDSILDFNKKAEEEQREIERVANELLYKKAEEQREKLLNESKETEDLWKKEELKEDAKLIVAQTVDIQKRVINQEGISIKKTWKARVIDINIVPKEFLIIEANIPMLNKIAREIKDNVLFVPGIQFYEESSVSSR